MKSEPRPAVTQAEVRVPIGLGALTGDLTMPEKPFGLVLFAHGSGSGRQSPRNQYVAGVLQERHLATLLLDLLTAEEDKIDESTAQYRFDIPMLAGRLVATIDWLRARSDIGDLPIGLFGASTGAGAALLAAASRPRDVAAVVSRGGRPDLAAAALGKVLAPTLLIVGGLDGEVIRLNEAAKERMSAEAMLEIVPGATHLFPEPGALEHVAALAAGWFACHLQPSIPVRGR